MSEARSIVSHRYNDGQYSAEEESDRYTYTKIELGRNGSIDTKEDKTYSTPKTRQNMYVLFGDCRSLYFQYGKQNCVNLN